MAKKRPFGTKRMLPSGRVQATYVGPDGRRHKAPFTFNNRQQAAAYLDGPFVRAFSPNDDLQGNPNLHAVDLQFVNKLSSHETFGVRVIDANGSHTAKFPIEGARAIAEKVLAANCVPQ